MRFPGLAACAFAIVEIMSQALYILLNAEKLALYRELTPRDGDYAYQEPQGSFDHPKLRTFHSVTSTLR